MRKNKFIEIVVKSSLLLLLMAFLAIAAPYPPQNLNPYYQNLTDFLNTSLSIEGTLFDGRLKQNITASFYDFNVTNFLLVIGNMNITDTLNATNIYMDGQLVQTESPAFKYSNWSLLTDNSTIIRFGNTSWLSNAISNDTIQRQAPAFNNINWTNLLDTYSNAFFRIINFTTNYENQAYYKRQNLSDDLSSGIITNIRTNDINTNLLTVNQMLIVIGNITNANVTNININGSLYPALDNQFELGNGTLKWKSANFSGTIQAGFFSGDGSLLTNMPFSNFRIENVSNTTKVSNILDNNLLSKVSDAYNDNNLTTKYPNLDTDSTNDFSGAYSALTGTPATSNMQIDNISNDTLHKSDNLSIIGYVQLTNISMKDYVDSLPSGGSSNCSVTNSCPQIIYSNNRSFVLEMLDNTTINRSVDLSSYNKSIDLSSYNKSISLIDYLTALNRSFVLEMLNNATINRSIDISIYNKSIDLSAYNQSIALSSYNKSISLIDYLTSLNRSFVLEMLDNATINRSIDLSTYNKSIDLSSYPKTAITNGSDAILNNLNVTNINGTDIALFNKSIDLSSYNKSISLVGYLTTSFLSAFYNLANFTTHYDLRTDRYGNANFTTAYDTRTDRFTYENLTHIGNININTSGSLNVSGQGYFGGNVGIGTTAPAEKLVIIGNVNISGTLNVSGRVAFPNVASQNCLGTDAGGVLQAGTCVDASAFNLVNYSTEYSSTGYKLANFTSHYDTRTDRFLNLNWTTLWDTFSSNAFRNLNWTTLYDTRADRWQILNQTNREGAYFTKTNYSEEYASTGFKIGNLTAPTVSVAFNNVTTTQTNNTLGNFSIIQYNASCSGFRMGTTGGLIMSCTP